MEQIYNIEVDKFKSHQHSNGISTRGGYAKMYKKSANKQYEDDIVWQLLSQFNSNSDYKQINTPLSLSIDFSVKIPTTINKLRLTVKERKELQGQWAPSKPDLTNIIKTIEDCIERAGIINNDMLIVKYDSIEKKYNSDVKDKQEYAKITLKKLD